MDEITVSYLPRLPRNTFHVIERHALAEEVHFANEALSFFDRRLRFYVHEKTGRTIVALVNTQTNRVVKEIPQKEFLDTVAKIKEIIKGLLE